MEAERNKLRSEAAAAGRTVSKLTAQLAAVPKARPAGRPAQCSDLVGGLPDLFYLELRIYSKLTAPGRSVMGPRRAVTLDLACLLTTCGVWCDHSAAGTVCTSTLRICKANLPMSVAAWVCLPCVIATCWASTTRRTRGGGVL